MSPNNPPPSPAWVAIQTGSSSGLPRLEVCHGGGGHRAGFPEASPAREHGDLLLSVLASPLAHMSPVSNSSCKNTFMTSCIPSELGRGPASESPPTATCQDSIHECGRTIQPQNHKSFHPRPYLFLPNVQPEPSLRGGPQIHTTPTFTPWTQNSSQDLCLEAPRCSATLPPPTCCLSPGPWPPGGGLLLSPSPPHSSPASTCPHHTEASLSFL